MNSEKNNAILIRKIIFFLLGILCLFPFISPPIALFLGLLFAQFVGHPFPHLNQKATSLLLKISVVGLGFGMNLNNAIEVGKDGFLFTISSIVGVLVLGYLIGKLLKIDKKISYLISVGTAICGGSAIAAISPIIKAKENQISIAIGTVFILNSVALFIFPSIGSFLQLSQQQFGMWCAIAIHDTSSVVGAASKYGEEALQIATTVKLARALWIIPLAFASVFVVKNKSSKLKIPYFIGLFILAMIPNTYIPYFAEEFGVKIAAIAKTGLTLTLFLIGSGLNSTLLKSVGFKPLAQGLILWLIISSITLWIVHLFFN